jgi:hypothetical protein
MVAGAHRILRLVTRRQGVAEPVAVIRQAGRDATATRLGRPILRLLQLARRRSRSWPLPHPY